jgi:Methyltransferase domain
VILTRPTNQGSKWSVSIWALILTNVLVFQITWNLRGGGGDDERYDLLTLTSPGATSGDFILAPPEGKAVALPSVRVSSDAVKSDKIYGGHGDKPHLGGFTDLDHHGVSPAVWKWMITDMGVHSLLDVGCGRGISTSWFYFHGVDVQCVEGSHDAIQNTVMPDPSRIVEHDFSRGPWWPDKTYDAVWCVEFLEHVSDPALLLENTWLRC